MKNKISVAMTTYNGEKYLREQLDSLYSQTLQPNEIIVVDDCSTDSTPQILEEYHQNKGLIYIINDKNLGVNKNFEKAISLCHGDYIALCDQDDVWLPNKIEITYKKIREIENNQPALVSSNKIDVDKDLNILSYPSSKVDSNHFSTTLLGHHSQGCTLMMNRKLVSCILPIPEDSKMIFDIYIGLTAAMIGYKYNLSESLIYYRRHEDNVCGRISKNHSIFKRFKSKYSERFPGLIPEGRFHNMNIVEYYQSTRFHQEKKDMFYTILSLEKAQNIFNKMSIIQNIPNVRQSHKFISMFNALIAHFNIKFL